MSRPSHSRNVRLFRNGRSQVLRIPREFELPRDEVVLYRDGDRLIVEAVPRKRNSLSEFLASLPPIGEGLPEVEDPPVESEEIF